MMTRDPILELVDEEKRLGEAYGNAEGRDDAAAEVLFVRWNSINDQVNEAEPVSLEGAIALLETVEIINCGSRLDNAIAYLRSMAQVVPADPFALTRAEPSGLPIATAPTLPWATLPPVLLFTGGAWCIGYWCEDGWYHEAGGTRLYPTHWATLPVDQAPGAIGTG